MADLDAPKPPTSNAIAESGAPPTRDEFARLLCQLCEAFERAPYDEAAAKFVSAAQAEATKFEKKGRRITHGEHGHLYERDAHLADDHRRLTQLLGSVKDRGASVDDLIENMSAAKYAWDRSWLEKEIEGWVTPLPGKKRNSEGASGLAARLLAGALGRRSQDTYRGPAAIEQVARLDGALHRDSESSIMAALTSSWPGTEEERGNVFKRALVAEQIDAAKETVNSYDAESAMEAVGRAFGFVRPARDATWIASELARLPREEAHSMAKETLKKPTDD